ncbi:uncharacterized protein TRUGW13939_03035 [Talaromyces rugulosus]|uniref:GPI anchored protein n=1 Tax=Talaromyces rugulosus TaxID=121627 RepID=A0A7H8QQ02_TALRU|nr:uncharacterized protein TRUGW13939_03035 [Talaromyces rugulosus]QKX55936.1 hypothetical protein TRUGW13939_03035 [Talaromyces rugulosus]
MRSGLQTPGAIPLLAMLVAALLSMTPIVCEAWSKPGRILDSRGYQDVLADGSVVSRPAMEIYLPGDDGTLLESKNAPASRLAQPVSVQKDEMQQISITSLSNNVNVLPFPEKEVTWWQRVCRLSSLASVSFSNASSSSPSSSSAPSSGHADLPKQPGPDQSSSNKVSMGAKTPQSATVENSSSSLHNSIVDSSSPIERNGSFLAVMVSLIVAIMWF